MSLEELLKKRIIQKIEPDKKVSKELMKISKRDLETAKLMYKHENYDWCLATAYNAMLQAGRALMFSLGYRAYTKYHHVGVVLFLHEMFETKISDRLIYFFDKIRKKRHRVIYDISGIVSEEEAKMCIETAEKFVKKIEKILKELGEEK